MNTRHSTRHNSEEEALLFAAEFLGPSSAEALQSKAGAEQLHIELARDLGDSSDAALRVIHSMGQSDRALVDEFLGYFFNDLLRLGSGKVGSRLRSMLDTQDLVQSVMKDVWADMAKLEFRTRGSFHSLMSQRLEWKASDRGRMQTRDRRREDKRVEMPEQISQDDFEGQLTQMGNDERKSKMWLAILRLPEPERTVMGHHVEGDSVPKIAIAMGLDEQETRRAFDRGIYRLRRELGD